MATTNYLSNWAGTTLGNQTPTAAHLARALTPTMPMCSPSMDPERMVVLMDIPEDLQNALNKGMKKIDLDCLRENAEMVLQLFESICLQHVLDGQINDKVLRRLTQRDPSVEKDNNADKGKQLAPKSKIARSSIIGRDPWGDESLPALPKRGAREASATTGESDEEETQSYSNVQLL